jgi:hypothetical protein
LPPLPKAKDPQLWCNGGTGVVVVVVVVVVDDDDDDDDAFWRTMARCPSEEVSLPLNGKEGDDVHSFCVVWWCHRNPTPSNQVVVSCRYCRVMLVVVLR